VAEAYLLVSAGGRQVGLPVVQLEGVADPGLVTAVPSGEPSLRGISTVRGVTLPVVSLRALLDGTGVGEAPAEVAVIVSVGGIRLCLEVDAVDIVFRGEPMPAVGEGSTPWARSVTRHEGKLVPLLDLGALGARLTETGRA
jgi:chemotaxis signal transduction protein